MPLLFKEEDHVDVSSTTIGTKEIQWRKKVNKKKKVIVKLLALPVTGEMNKKKG